MQLTKKQIMLLGSIATMANSFCCKKGSPIYHVSPWMIAVPFGTASNVIDSFKLKNLKTLYKKADFCLKTLKVLTSFGLLREEKQVGLINSDGQYFDEIYFIKDHARIKSLISAYYKIIGNKPGITAEEFARIREEQEKEKAGINPLDEEISEVKDTKKKVLRKSATLKPASKVAKAKKATTALKKAKKV